MNKKLIALVAPFALAAPLAMAAAPAQAVPTDHRPDQRFQHHSPLTCDINAHLTRRGNIRVNITVADDNLRRAPLHIRVTDNWRTVAAGTVFTRLPYHDSGIVRNLRGPDRFVLTATNLRTGEQCSDTDTVWPRERRFFEDHDLVSPIL